MPRQTSPVIRHVPLTQARASLGNIVNEVNREGEYVVVERGGLPVAVIIDFDEFEDYLDLRDPAARERIAEARRDHRAGHTSPAADLLPRLRKAAAAGRTRRKTAAAKR
jgi:prevent-host-death family protein